MEYTDIGWAINSLRMGRRVRVLAVDSNAPKSVKLAFFDGTSGSVITVEEEQ